MKKIHFRLIICLVLLFVWSCTGHKNTKNSAVSGNGILQQEDGTVSLKLEKASFYKDDINPSNNTAEWNMVISKPGRFKVWLSSATKDTTELSYMNSVRISLLDDILEVYPACDRIVQNSGDVPYQYFRADSYMGTISVSEPGNYNIQLISEKVISKNSENKESVDDTKLLSVILTPLTR
jgi:hypothetical protein